MVDPAAISRTILRGLKQRVFGKSQYGNKQWEEADAEWYKKIHNQNEVLHQDFIKYFQEKEDVNSVLEVGCGTGVYPIEHKELFLNKQYTGIDFSKPNIEFCRSKSDFQFISGDFLKMDLSDTYDLVYSHAVIDHVYDVDEFLKRIVRVTKKYAYINAYRGYFPSLESHKMNWRDDDNCYYNDLSIKQAKRTLLDSGLKEEEIVIRKQDNSTVNSEKYEETVIEITKNKK